MDRGSVHYLGRRYALAIADYDRALELDAANPIAFNNRGRAYEKLGQKALAARDFRRAHALDERFAYATF